MTKDHPGSKDRLNTALENATQTLSAFSTQVYRDVKGKPVPEGTCFFIQEGSQVFLVSAAHVLFRAQDLYFYSAPDEKRPLSGQLARSGKNKALDNDAVDVGVLLLGDGAKPPFPAVGKSSMPVSYLRPKRTPRSGHYVFVGFPATKTYVNNRTKQVEVQAYAYRNISVPDDDYSSYGLSPETHLVLPLDLKKGIDAEGRHAHFPKPQGMSGSPVFELFRPDEAKPGRSFPIVAVATMYKQKLIRATDVSFVLDAITALKRKFTGGDD
jgi:hypothetical protein